MRWYNAGMFIALIHWRIVPDRVDEFLQYWKNNNTIGERKGLIAEFLSESLPQDKLPIPIRIPISWHLDENSLGDFKSYVTVGLWKDSEAFYDQVKGYLNEDRPMLPFEKYRRRRVIFDSVCWRIGQWKMPETDSPGAR
jgi:hypothetical protein